MIADYLRNRLQELGMSQAELANRLTLQGQDYTRAAVQQWVNGSNYPPLKNASFRIVLASILEISEIELAEAMGFPIDESTLSREAARAAEIVNRLPDDVKVLALEYLDVLDRHWARG